MMSPCILSCTNLCSSSADCQHNLASKQPARFCLQTTLQALAQYVLLTTRHIPSHLLTHQHSPNRIRVPPSNLGPATDYSDRKYCSLPHRLLVISKCFSSNFNRPRQLHSHSPLELIFPLDEVKQLRFKTRQQ
jgi:hypothetical protein